MAIGEKRGEKVLDLLGRDRLADVVAQFVQLPRFNSRSALARTSPEAFG